MQLLNHVLLDVGVTGGVVTEIIPLLKRVSSKEHGRNPYFTAGDHLLGVLELIFVFRVIVAYEPPVVRFHRADGKVYVFCGKKRKESAVLLNDCPKCIHQNAIVEELPHRILVLFSIFHKHSRAVNNRLSISMVTTIKESLRSSEEEYSPFIGESTRKTGKAMVPFTPLQIYPGLQPHYSFI